jgi:hypothetical protein
LCYCFPFKYKKTLFRFSGRGFARVDLSTYLSRSRDRGGRRLVIEHDRVCREATRSARRSLTGACLLVLEEREVCRTAQERTLATFCGDDHCGVALRAVVLLVLDPAGLLEAVGRSGAGDQDHDDGDEGNDQLVHGKLLEI